MKRKILILSIISLIVITLYYIQSNINEAEDTMSPEIEKFRKVLVNEEELYCTNTYPYQNQKVNYEYNGYLNKLSFNGDRIKISQFAVVDLDGDEVVEIVLSIENYGGFVVLRYRESGVVGTVIGYRSMREIKEDGSFWQSGSAAESYISKLCFVDNIWITRNRIRKNDIYYYKYDIACDEAEWEEAVNVYNNTKDVEWHNMTKREIKQWVVGEFVSEEKAQVNAERQNYLDSLSYLISYTYDYSVKSQSEINRDAKAYYNCCNNEMDKIFKLCKDKLSGVDLEELEKGQIQWQEAINRRMGSELYELKKVHSIEELNDQRLYYTYGDIILQRIFYLIDLYYECDFYNGKTVYDEEIHYDDLVKEFYLDSGELCPVKPFAIDKDRTGGCHIVFENGLEVCLPESWESQVLVEPYMRGISVNAKSGGNLMELSFVSKPNIGDFVLQLFPWEKIIGIYTESEDEYAIIYKPAMDYPLAFGETKSEFLKLYNDIGEIQILLENMSGVVSDGEENAWVKYRDDIRLNRNKENKDKILLVEATYIDDRFYAEPGVSAEDSELVYYELCISNVSDETFDFLVVKTERRTGKSVVVVPESTAIYNKERTEAKCSSEYGCIEFAFDYNELAKLIGIITIEGIDELEGIDFRCNHVPGYGVA